MGALDGRLILLGVLCAAAQDVPLTEPSEKVN